MCKSWRKRNIQKTYRWYDLCNKYYWKELQKLRGWSLQLFENIILFTFQGSNAQSWRLRMRTRLEGLTRIAISFGLCQPLAILSLYLHRKRGIYSNELLLIMKTPWRNGSASDSRSEGCVFESRRGQLIFLTVLQISIFSNFWREI